jgi:hypothetical protein
VQNESLPVRVLEVDCSHISNRQVCDAYVPGGYPTLKLFRKSKVLDEYHGARDAKPLCDWIKRAVSFVFEDPRVVQISSKADLDTFLQGLIDRPVVISASGPSTPLDVRTEWNSTVDVMRERSARNVAFVSVPDWTVLVGPRESLAWANFTSGIPFCGMAPFAIGSHSAAALLAEGKATWWFDGVAGADSLETFMHLSTMSTTGGGRLVEENAEFVTATMQWTLVLMLDSAPGPSWVLEDKMAMFAPRVRVLPIYFRPSDVPGLRDHLGFENRESDEFAGLDKIEFAIYRAASGGVEKLRYSTSSPSDVKSLLSWADTYAEWGVNMTSRASDVIREEIEERYKMIEISRLSPRLVGTNNPSRGSRSSANFTKLVEMCAVMSKPVTVVASSWSRIVERDGRSVLLLLFQNDCVACRLFMPTFDSVAEIIAGDIDAARSVFAAQMLITSNELPPYLERPHHMPAVYMLVAGESPLLYSGHLRAEDIASFARQQGKPPHVKEGAVHAALQFASSDSRWHGSGFTGAVMALLLIAAGLWGGASGAGVKLTWRRGHARVGKAESSPCQRSGAEITEGGDDGSWTRRGLLSLGDIKVQ